MAARKVPTTTPVARVASPTKYVAWVTTISSKTRLTADDRQTVNRSSRAWTGLIRSVVTSPHQARDRQRSCHGFCHVCRGTHPTSAGIAASVIHPGGRTPSRRSSLIKTPEHGAADGADDADSQHQNEQAQQQRSLFHQRSSSGTGVIVLVSSVKSRLSRSNSIAPRSKRSGTSTRTVRRRVVLRRR